jgi:hypothetical protein
MDVMDSQLRRLAIDVDNRVSGLQKRHTGPDQVKPVASPRDSDPIRVGYRTMELCYVRPGPPGEATYGLVAISWRDKAHGHEVVIEIAARAAQQQWEGPPTYQTIPALRALQFVIECYGKCVPAYFVKGSDFDSGRPHEAAEDVQDTFLVIHGETDVGRQIVEAVRDVEGLEYHDQKFPTARLWAVGTFSDIAQSFSALSNYNEHLAMRDAPASVLQLYCRPRTFPPPSTFDRDALAALEEVYDAYPKLKAVRLDDEQTAVACRLVGLLRADDNVRLWEFLRGNAGTAKTTMVVFFIATVRTLRPTFKMLYVSAQHAQCNDLIDRLEQAGITDNTVVARFGHSKKAKDHSRHIDKVASRWMLKDAATDEEWLKTGAAIKDPWQRRGVAKKLMQQRRVQVAVMTAQGMAGQKGVLQDIQPNVACADEASQLHAYVLYSLDLPEMATIMRILVVGGKRLDATLDHPMTRSRSVPVGPFWGAAQERQLVRLLLLAQPRRRPRAGQRHDSAAQLQVATSVSVIRMAAPSAHDRTGRASLATTSFTTEPLLWKLPTGKTCLHIGCKRTAVSTTLRLWTSPASSWSTCLPDRSRLPATRSWRTSTSTTSKSSSTSKTSCSRSARGPLIAAAAWLPLRTETSQCPLLGRISSNHLARYQDGGPRRTHVQETRLSVRCEDNRRHPGEPDVCLADGRRLNSLHAGPTGRLCHRRQLHRLPSGSGFRQQPLPDGRRRRSPALCGVYSRSARQHPVGQRGGRHSGRSERHCALQCRPYGGRPTARRPPAYASGSCGSR